MSLGQHLVEFRKRITIAGIALIVGMVVAFFITDFVINVITEPIRVVAETRGDEIQVELMFATVTSAFDLRLRMSFAIGLMISAPIWMWQVWAFIMPGLTRKEVRYTIGFLLAAIPLFFAGCYMGLIIMPHIVELMASFVPDGGASFYDAAYYYDFVFKLLIVVGVAFVLPVFLVALNFAGVISGRDILKGWRVAVLVSVIFSALATPAADVASMLMLSGIMVVLFFAAAALSLIFDKRRHKREAALLASETPEISE
ncbi:twin-arginine translocase subunit TatC (plasmid) [Coraliomargarita sp. W4R53]